MKGKGTKGKKSSILANDIDYWLSTPDPIYNRLAAQFYGKIRNSPNWPVPLEVIETFQLFSILIMNEKDKPARFLTKLEKKFDENRFTIKERHGIVFYLTEYIEAVCTDPILGTIVGPKYAPLYNLLVEELSRLDKELDSEIKKQESKPDSRVVNKKQESKFTQRQISMALFCMKIDPRSKEGKDLFKKHAKKYGNSNSPKKHTYSKSSDLTNTTESKRSDAHKLRDLKEANRLLTIINHKDGISTITQYIQALQTNIDRYEY